jgi:uncharacterized membrane protein
MLLLVVQPAQIRALVRVLAQDELSEDPHEALAQWLARLADRIDVDSLTFRSEVQPDQPDRSAGYRQPDRR